MGLKVSAIFAKDKLEETFQEIEGMKAEARAEKGTTPSDDEKCTAEGRRVVKLLLKVMTEGKMSGLPERDSVPARLALRHGEQG